VFVAWREELEVRLMASVRVMGKPVAVFRGKGGAFVAREMACKHQGADLVAGDFRGVKVTCPRHGWQYDISTGECLNKDSPPLREHEVVVERDAVFVSLFPKQNL
jgi:nitrite reductase/ring-hydroxylating ferredoxin subunit